MGYVESRVWVALGCYSLATLSLLRPVVLLFVLLIPMWRVDIC